MLIYTDTGVSEDGVKYEFFTIISTDSLIIYESKYLQGYLDNCAYKVVNAQMIVTNAEFVAIGIAIMGRNFKILFVMVIRCVLILATLLLSLLKVLIIVALFMALSSRM